MFSSFTWFFEKIKNVMMIFTGGRLEHTWALRGIYPPPELGNVQEFTPPLRPNIPRRPLRSTTSGFFILKKYGFHPPWIHNNISVLSIPISSAETERGFSALKYIRDAHRSSRCDYAVNGQLCQVKWTWWLELFCCSKVR